MEPALPDLPDAVRRGLVRYCPICDGFEARGRRIAVIGHGQRVLGEAVFVARTYSRDVTLLKLGQGMKRVTSAPRCSDWRDSSEAADGTWLAAAPVSSEV